MSRPKRQLVSNPPDYLTRAHELVEAGDTSAAKEVLRHGLHAISRAGGQIAGEALNGYAHLCVALSALLVDEGDAEEAVRTMIDLRSRCRAAGVAGGELFALANLVSLNAQIGDLETAARYARELPDVWALPDRHEIEGLEVGSAENVARLLSGLAYGAYYDREDYEHTAALAEVAVQLAPEAAEGWFFLAYSRLRLERYAESIATFDKLISITPGQPGPYLGRASALQSLDRTDAAIESVNLALALRPDDHRYVWDRARLNRAAGRNEQALADFDRTIALAEKSAADAPAADRGYISQTDYERDLPAADLVTFASMERLIVLHDLGRVDEAIRDARTLGGSGADGAEAAHRFLGEWLLERGESAAAEQEFTVAIDAGIQVAAARLGRARSRLALGLVEAALTDLQALSGSALTDAEVLSGEGRRLTESHHDKDPAGAVTVLSELVEAHPEVVVARRALGHALLEDWKPAAAVTELDRALTEVPDDWPALLWRGLARVTHSNEATELERTWNATFSLKRVLDALADLVAAVQLAPPGEARPLIALRWLLERAISIPALLDALSEQAVGAHDLGHAITEIIPQLRPAFGRIMKAKSQLWPEQRWAEAEAELAAARAEIDPAHLPILAVQLDLLLADTLLRSYEVQRALDHILAAETALPLLGELLGGMRQPYLEFRRDLVERRGRALINIDFDHFELSGHAVMSTVRTANLLRAQALARIGAPEQALDSIVGLDDILERAAAGEDTRSAIPVIEMLRDSGQCDRALRAVRGVRGVRAHRTDVDQHERLLNLEATIHIKMGDLEGAEAILTDVLPQVEAGEIEHPIPFVHNLAAILLARGKHRPALRLLDDHRPGPSAQLPHQAGWRALRGEALLQDHRPAEGLREFEIALDLYDQVRGALRAEDARISWHSNRLEILERAIIAAVMSNDDERALELTERGRARAFIDQLELGHPQLTPEAVDLADSLDQARSRRRLLLRLAEMPDPGTEIEVLRELAALGGDLSTRTVDITAEALARELGQESRAVRTLEERLQAQTLGARESIAGAVVSVADIRRLLAGAPEPGGPEPGGPEPGGPEPGGRVLLAEYFSVGNRVLLFLVGAETGQITAHLFDLHYAELHASVTKWIGTASRGHLFDAAELNAALAPIVEPVIAFSRPGDLIWFVPHGVLHYVPLHAVRVGGQTLVERNPICYTPSASVLAQCRARRATATARTASGTTARPAARPAEQSTGRPAGQPYGWRRALVLGDSRTDLAHARAEARVVAELFRTSPYLTGEATKAILTDLREPDEDGPDVIHIACHGVFDVDQALRSGLLLAPEPGGREDDALLTAEEVYGLRLRSGLVTLSACQTGVSERRPGEELIGLTRAFMYAGATAIIVSLWSVDDLSTGLLMEDFYGRLLGTDGRSPVRPVEALRRAQVALMSMTAREAIERMNERIAQAADPTERLHQSLGLARLHVLAGDLNAAITIYEDLLRAGHAGSMVKMVERRLRLLRFKLTAPTPVAVDHETRPFAHPYYWAAFALVGDWN